jgi:hypothetical protein
MGGSKALPQLRNLAMELRKLCCHPVGALASARQAAMVLGQAEPCRAACVAAASLRRHARRRAFGRTSSAAHAMPRAYFCLLTPFHAQSLCDGLEADLKRRFSQARAAALDAHAADVRAAKAAGALSFQAQLL